MTLAPGARLGPYEILAPAGSGGMGEVYRARDTRLGRDVALKVIVAAAEGHPEMQRRFEEEVRLGARLDHPRICAVYDTGQQDGFRYFVMEFLEGESLAARLARGRLGTSQLLGYAIEIASALAYAHRRHVLHRDLTPSNVFLTPAGVKILDFGLATIRRELEGAPSDISTLKTRPLPATQPSIIYGTPEYVAPERLEGRTADHRSDIFAFGTVLYEMASGRRAFEAPTPAALFAAILSSDPPPIVSHGAATAGLEWVVRRCLKKDPDERWQSMSDIELVLKWLAAGDASQARRPAESDGASIAPAAGGMTLLRSPRMRAAWTIAAVLVCSAVGIAARSWLSPPVRSTPPVVRLSLPVEPFPTINFGVDLGSRVALSRDGRRIAYVSDRGKGTSVYLRQMASGTTEPVEGTDGATTVFFSPDGDQLGFFAGGKLKKVRLQNGAIANIYDVTEGAAGATWGDDDTIVFAPSPMSPLFRVPAAGGTPTPVTALQGGETSHRWPEFLPGGAIAYAAASGTDFSSPRIFVQSLQNNRRTEVAAGTYPRYVPGGQILFARDASVFALPFDAARLRAHGRPEPIVTDLRMNTPTGAAVFAVSETALVYGAVAASQADRQLVWVGTDGKEEVLPLEPRAFLQPRLSRDGTRVAISVGERAAVRDVWIYDLVRHTLRRLTFDPGEDETAVWSPRDDRIALSASRNGQPPTILVLPASGGPATKLSSTPYNIHVGDWSPDGRALAWTEFNPNSGGRIHVSALDGSGAVRTVAGGPFDARGPAFSPDGRWIAYASNESGRDEVYVQAYPGTGDPWRVSTGGGQQPVWSRDGKMLYYRGEARVMAVEVRTTPTFEAGLPHPLFIDNYETEHRSDRNYDVSPDGRRFLMLKPARPYPAAHLNVVLNWATLGHAQ